MPYKNTPEEVYKRGLLKELYGEQPGPIEKRVRDYVTRLEITGELKLVHAELAYTLARVLDYDAQNSSHGIAKELRELLGTLVENKDDLSDIFGNRMSP